MQEKKTIISSKFLNKLVLFIALSMMVSSAMISYFFVRQNEPQINFLRTEVQAKQALIRDVWNNIVKKESRADIAILLSVLTVRDGTNIQAIKRNYLIDFPELNEQSSTEDIIKEVKKETMRNGEYIDNLYLEQAAIQDKISRIEHSSKLFSDAAFFLQILSLILIILRRDLHISE